MKLKFSLQTIIIGFVVLVHIFILSQIVFFPYPELLIYSYLTDKGMLAYKSIFDQHFPGIMFFPLNLYSIGFNSPERLKIFQYLIVICNHLIIFNIVKRIKSTKLPVIAALTYLLWQIFLEGHVLWIDSFVSTLLLAAYYFYLKQTNKSMFLSGLMLSLSLLMKQVAAPLIFVFSIYLLFKTDKKGSYKYYIAGLIIPLGYLFYWVVSNDIIYEFYYWTFVYNLTTFEQMGRKAVSISQIARLTPLILPSVYLLIKRKHIPFVIFAICSLFFAYARFDYVHLQPFLVFVPVSFIYVKKYWTKIFFYSYIFVVLLGGVILNIKNINYLFPERTLFFSGFEYDLAQSVRQYAGDNESVFILGTTPHIYYLTNTLPPGKLFVFQFPWFMVEVEDKIYAGIIQDPPKVVLRDQQASVSGMNLVKYAPVINQYINDNYYLAETISDVEILLPKN